MDFNVNVFTLNCWGIPIVSKDRKERIVAIAKYVEESSHSIVCLQEVWSEGDYLYIKDVLKSVLPYSHYFYSGVLGSGLCVFSKWLIEDVFFHQWSLNGYIHKIHHGDWFGGKGVGLCRIKCGKKLINIYCTHLHAEYHEDDIYLAHRVLQAYSTAEFIKLTSAPADISILAGDLNTAPGDLSFKIITELPQLIDPCTVITKELEGTCDNANNSYSNPKTIISCPGGKRIDHILYKADPAFEVEITDYGNPLPDRVSGKPFSYSDHNAVSLNLTIKPANNEPLLDPYTKDEFNETVTQTIKVCEEAMSDLIWYKKMFLLIGGIMFFLVIGSIGYAQDNYLYGIVKLVATGVSFYYIIMGTLWHRIEMNSLKAGKNALENCYRARIGSVDPDIIAKLPKEHEK